MYVFSLAPKKLSLFSEQSPKMFCNFTKNRLEHRCFLVKYAKSLRTPTFSLVFVTDSKTIFCGNFGAPVITIHLANINSLQKNP